MDKNINRLSELIDLVAEIGRKTDSLLVFRGEKKDYGDTALVPFVYRNDNYISNEENIYRESQRFNDNEFNIDKTAFDKLSRIQHYSAPTRLIDVSEDLFSAIYFSIAEKNAEVLEKLSTETEKEFLARKNSHDAVIYLFEIDKEKIKYYDSDTISVISNLAKIPLSNTDNEKSKETLLNDVNKYKNDIKKFNKQKSVKFLRHEIREEKPQFKAIINPQHLVSIQFVYPKFTNNRVKSQKGAFLVFGLNNADASQTIKLIDEHGFLIKSEDNKTHPVLEIHKAILKYDNINKMKEELKSLGIIKPFIYPEIDKVSEHLVEKYQYKP
jgi:hypothetical protein